MIYLAGPYSHPEREVIEQRYDQHVKHLAHLLNDGLIVFSPIVHWHVVATRHMLPHGWEFWGKLDLSILDRCDKVIVLTLPGWESSIGTTAEIEHAKSKNIPIEYHAERK